MEIGAIYEGDNIDILHSFSDNSVDLIYADPPFYSGKPYELIWKDEPERRSFEDRWSGGIQHYIGWMEPRLKECWRVLKPTGSVFLHCDWHADAYLRILLDKIFGYGNFRNEIVWCYTGASSPNQKQFPRKHDTIFWYSKGNKWTFNEDDVRIAYSQATLQRIAAAEGGGKSKESVFHGKRTERAVNEKGKIVEDWWDIPVVGSTSKERLGYPTQKPVALLERIIRAASSKNDVVLDPFCGCGTTLVASQKLSRKWVGIDFSRTACKLMQKRLRKEFGINPQIITGDVDIKYVKKLSHFEFQNWVVVDKFLGNVSKTKSNDKGVDGTTPQINGGYPIQVKQEEGIGRNYIDNFETAMRRIGKKKGYFVAFSFGRGAIEEVARAKNEEGLDITLRTVQELLDGKIE